MTTMLAEDDWVPVVTMVPEIEAPATDLPMTAADVPMALLVS